MYHLMKNGDSNQLSGRIVHGSQRVFPVVVLKDHGVQKTIQEEWQDQEQVPHVYSADLWRQSFVLSKVLENGCHVRSQRHQTVVLSPESVIHMQNMINM